MTLPTKVDTTFNLQSFLQALLLSGGIIGWAMSMERRVATVEAIQVGQLRTGDRLENKIDLLVTQRTK